MLKKLFVCCCLLLTGHFAAAQTARLSGEHAAALWTVENGSIEKGAAGVLRWRINNGQTSLLSLNPASPLSTRLYDYDLLQGEWRVASGEINEVGLYALGHVTGPRRGRVHQWTLGINTTPRQVWHNTILNLSRPSWLPWNNPDGEGTGAYFRFEAMALAPDTVIEFRNLRLKRARVMLKPDFETPVTWPLKTENADGSATYTLTYEVLNTANRRADIVARVLSSHSKFKVGFETDKAANVAHGGKAIFKLTATISAADIAATPELYAEPLRVTFGPADAPDADWPWNGVLVRPLSKGLKHQLVVSPADLELLRARLRAGDARAKKLTGYDRMVQQAEAFVNVRLDHIPGGYNSPATRFPVVAAGPGKGHRWQIGSFMPEIVEPQSGRREVGTPLAYSVWKYYLANGGATENLGDAYLLTGDEKYARKAVELLELYGRQYTQLALRDVQFDPPWSAGPNLLSSSRTSTSSTYGGNWNFKWIFKMLAAIGESQAWKDADKATIYNGFVLPYGTESMKFPGGISNMSDIASHNQLIAGLIFDDANLVYWATLRDSGLLKRLNDIDDDGFSSEGRPVTYHLAAMDEYLPALVYLGNSGLALPGFDKAKILKAFKMPYERATLAGRVPTTGDMARGYAVRKSKLADYLIGLFPDQTWLLDAGTGSTLAAQARLLTTSDSGAAPALFSAKPRLYRDAGFAILRSGETAETQVMATLDWGRSVMHSGFDRNQFTLAAFGKIDTHGPGSLYNVGSGGITRNKNPQLEAFVGYSTLSHNLVTVDGNDQLRAVGKLLKWSDDPARQLAVSRVDGIAPGVSHTRGVLLTRGIVVLLDRMESAEEHTYDWTYHNFGDLSLGEGWTGRVVEKPLGESNVYRNIIEPRLLQNPAPRAVLQARWDLSAQVNALRKETESPMFLNFWHGGTSGEYFSGTTGLNNPNTMIMPDAAPSIFHRVRARSADFWTVLEPNKGASKIRSVASGGQGRVLITFADGTRAGYDVDELLK